MVKGYWEGWKIWDEMGRVNKVPENQWWWLGSLLLCLIFLNLLGYVMPICPSYNFPGIPLFGFSCLCLSVYYLVKSWAHAQHVLLSFSCLVTVQKRYILNFFGKLCPSQGNVHWNLINSKLFSLTFEILIVLMNQSFIDHDYDNDFILSIFW